MSNLNVLTTKTPMENKIIFGVRWPGGRISTSWPDNRGSKRDSTEALSCILGLVRFKYNRESNVLTLVYVEGRRVVCGLRIRPFHITKVQNYEVSAKIVTVLFQKSERQS
ncbi:hypothetical protein AVEN_268245-1 [Araneus ventricosus]|uniref:Uncharacterized protein n=1 Tax=Araneus ventricosus TaxID=182803 RepID=A0A4Y2C0Z7_ARAVE|nr:hypothetical protein AVEN_268245-1 [Araneus ventricosus]